MMAAGLVILTLCQEFSVSLQLYLVEHTKGCSQMTTKSDVFDMPSCLIIHTVRVLQVRAHKHSVDSHSISG